MLDTGLLWAINRVLFHPRGYALTLVMDEEGQANGWFIQGDGSEVWGFEETVDDEKFAAFESLLAELKLATPHPVHTI